MHLFHAGTAAFKLAGGLMSGAVVIVATELLDVLPTVITEVSKISLFGGAALYVVGAIRAASKDRLDANDAALARWQEIALTAEQRLAEERTRHEAERAALLARLERQEKNP